MACNAILYSNENKENFGEINTNSSKTLIQESNAANPMSAFDLICFEIGMDEVVKFCKEAETNGIEYDKENQTVKPKFECKICFKFLASQASLNRHVRVVHEKLKPYSCDICCKDFALKRLLKEHQIAEHSKKPWEMFVNLEKINNLDVQSKFSI